MKLWLVPSLLFFTGIAYAQQHGFPFGNITYRELEMKTYTKDTTASAVVLNEFGEAYIDNYNNHDLIFEYHVKIKILKKAGVSYADIEIPTFKQEGKSEMVYSIKASAFNLENNKIVETALSDKNIFTDNRSKHYDIKKFAIPNVRVGTVIEFQYKLTSPFLFNFKNWEFQSDIPKVHSEYWTRIPANYVYNVSLRGFLKLSKEESEVIKDCFTPGSGVADCVLSKFAIGDIPAFVEEDYMTARSNYLSAINFELSEFKSFDGRVNKYTKKWEDAEQELLTHQDFGLQIKKGKDIVDEHIKAVVGEETDPLKKARNIYDFIKNWYEWNGVYSKYSEVGIKKAFDQKKGNVGDINLSLIAALRFAGLSVEPVILSTRENGLPIEIYPVISDFNYVIAKINIGAKMYLADATDDFHPFGLLPERCLNGKGRALGGEKGSYWLELQPAGRAKRISMFTLTLDKEGIIKGTIQTTYTGYEAVSKRKALYKSTNHEEHIAAIAKQMNQVEVKKFEIKNADDVEKPLVQNLEIEIEAFNTTTDNFFFNPFLLGKWDENPFKSDERLFPVDFGTTMEYVTILNLVYPENYEVINSPEKTGLSLPNGGGRFVFELQNIENKLSVNNALIISKTLFPSTEYHHLKELFNHVVQVQNGDLIFKKKV